MPNDVNYFSKVKTLNLYYNNIEGTIPVFSGLPELEVFDATGNKLTGNVPDSLFNFPKIRDLYLLDNEELTGTIPEIRNDSLLQRVSIKGCSFTGSLPDSIGHATNLDFFQIEDNAIAGTIPPSLVQLPNMETLGLHGNLLTGTIPDFPQTDNNKLIEFAVGGNQLEGPLPANLGRLKALKIFYSEENNLVGSIDSELFGLPALEQVWLYNNGLSGNIPSIQSSAVALQQVYLNDNDLSGSLEDFLSNAPTTLQYVDVSQNSALQGSIPSSVGDLTAMKSFNASHCALTGSIPPELGNMVALKTLDLSRNGFIGDVPSELGNLNALVYLNLSINPSLLGDLNPIICSDDVFVMDAAIADCDGGLFENVLCDCCTECCDHQTGICSPNF
jgi:Leucine-rich repeat (LRR) protein